MEKQLGKEEFLMIRKNCNCLYISVTTIQLEVDMMSEDAKSEIKALAGVGKEPRRVGVKSASRLDSYLA